MVAAVALTNTPTAHTNGGREATMRRARATETTRDERS